MCSQSAGNIISETQISNISWRGHAPHPLAKSCLWYSVHPFSDRILSWGRQGKWTIWQFCPSTEESLKNALDDFHDFSTTLRIWASCERCESMYHENHFISLPLFSGKVFDLVLCWSLNDCRVYFLQIFSSPNESNNTT
jgi:hypothetical protein